MDPKHIINVYTLNIWTDEPNSVIPEHPKAASQSLMKMKALGLCESHSVWKSGWIYVPLN